jgi:hypothetical protein
MRIEERQAGRQAGRQAKVEGNAGEQRGMGCQITRGDATTSFKTRTCAIENELRWGSAVSH